MKILCVVGARPNFMKIGPVLDAFREYPDMESMLVHTGQHYDETMSKVFFDEMGLPRPDINLGVGSGTHGEQTARVMEAFESVLECERPDAVVVVGDVNSTPACSLVAAKLRVPVAHVEAGLRSFDRSMPEEINRLVTDTVSDFLFVTEPSGVENLKREGVPDSRIFFVGNVMIDTLVRNLERIDREKIAEGAGSIYGDYAVLTLHRPSNVDDGTVFERIARALAEIGGRIPILFPVHPRTRDRIIRFGIDNLFHDYTGSGKMGVRLMPPLGALEFLSLMRNAKFVLTDSGGIQEETTFLQIPCITIRENTERPVTVDVGTNILTGSDPDRITAAAEDILNGRFKEGRVPELWDGRAAQRIARILFDALSNKCRTI